MLVGTNREKTLDEIKSGGGVLHGMEPLKAALQKIAPGQYVTWSSRSTLAFPPEDIVRQVEEVCKERGVILSMAR